jgi:hypothetical protein
MSQTFPAGFGFAEHRAGVVVDEFLDVRRPIARRKPHRHTLARQQMGEQRMRGSIELWNRDDIGTEPGQVLHRIVEGRLPGRDAQRVDAPLECGDAALQYVRGRIGDAAVAIAFDLEIEKGRAVLGAVEREGHGLIDRDRHGFRRGVTIITAVNRDGLALHDLARNFRRAAVALIDPRTHRANIAGSRHPDTSHGNRYRTGAMWAPDVTKWYGEPQWDRPPRIGCDNHNGRRSRLPGPSSLAIPYCPTDMIEIERGGCPAGNPTACAPSFNGPAQYAMKPMNSR